MQLSLLRYPRKSHRKVVSIPTESSDLAELMGIIIGDGGINNPWQLIITMNSSSDFEYSIYITKLIKKLFQIRVFSRKRPKENTLDLVTSSTTMIDFLVSKGAVRGSKVRQEVDIPKWIRSKPEYVKAFIRGLVDTDGCLFIHKHTVRSKSYKNIGFCFTNHSKRLIISTNELLLTSGINSHISRDFHHVYLYGHGAVLKYLSTFGSSNPRITRKYLEWRGV